MDDTLVAAVHDAVIGSGEWLVVVEGPSKVGKSRTLLHALQTCHDTRTLPLIAPVDTRDKDKVALSSLLEPGQRLPARGPAVLWLDDLEPFLANGLTLHTLREWRAEVPGRIVVATHGGKGRDLASDTKNLTPLAGGVLAHARRVTLAQTSDTELEGLKERIPRTDFEELRRYGLAAYLVAGPELWGRLNTEMDRAPEGTAIARAVIDWARCGRTDPIDETILRQIWTLYLPSRITPDDTAFATGLTWALAPVTGTIALVYRVDGYEAFDYVVRLAIEASAFPSPPDPVWATAIDTATDTQAAYISQSAYGHARLTDTEAALTRARESSNPEIAASAGYNLGVALRQLDRPQEALAAYQRVVADHSDNPAPVVRELVARALLNQGRVLGQLGHLQEASAACQRVVTEYSNDPDLRAQLAEALFDHACVLGRLGHPQKALANFERVVIDYANAPDLRERLAQALLGQGYALGQLGRLQEALAAYQRVVTDYANDPDLRELVARALFQQAVVLGQLGCLQEALAAYQRVVTDYRHDPHLDLREQLHRALLSKMIALGHPDRAPVEKLVAADSYLRELVAEALLNQGIVFGQLDHLQEALAAYQRVVTDYAADPDPTFRELVARALFYQGVVLGHLDRPREALDTYDRVVTDYSTDLGSTVRELVAAAASHLSEAQPVHQESD
ncbi:tetratricopeptide repeat protein [Nocardia sp. GAS34]|uniref:tetratricopeptide repeat protein n=1 Tax=unclassified Nocardia TaxID=2637762 RepID=UPI003D24A6DB